MVSSSTATVVQTLLSLDELVDNLLLLLSEKESFVITRRFNLNNERKFTLEEIGQEFSVTRERIRQIERTALSKMKRNVFNTPFRHLHEFVAAFIKERGGIMREKIILDELSGLLPANYKYEENKVRLCLVLHEDLECKGNTINFHPYLRDRKMPDHSLKYVAGQLVNQLHKHGDVKSVEGLCKDLKSSLEDVDFDHVDKLKSLIDIDKRLTLVDNELVGLLEWRHIHPRTLRDKILYVLRKEGKPMHFNAISSNIEGAKFDNRKLNVQAIHNELIRHEQFILIGRGIYALAEWGYSKGTVADVIERILNDASELSVDEIVNKVLEKRQVKRITILLALKNGEKFKRIGRKRYALA